MWSSAVLILLLSVVRSRPSAHRQHETTILPEQHMNATEIISYHGYPVEVVTVETEDGYFLQLHRIPFGRNEYAHANPHEKPMVFLQHGLLSSSADWVINLPTQSAAFLFADAGFDVWMGNVRGNCYSTGHRKFSRNGRRYWHFTWDEMAKYDLEAMINAVLNITSRSDLYYVGHSQGSATMFAKLCTDPQFGGKIKKFFALAPLASVGHISGPLGYVGRNLVNHIKALFVNLRDHEFSGKLIRKLLKLCKLWRFKNALCENMIFQVGGHLSNQFNQSRMAVYNSHVPCGTSTNNMVHWGQMVRTGKMQYYDFGTEKENKKHYGMAVPPVYDLTTVNVPVYLYWSDADWLADPEDIKETLLAQLKPEIVEQSNQVKDFNHFDFIFGIRAADEIYKPIIQIMKADEKQ